MKSTRSSADSPILASCLRHFLSTVLSAFLMALFSDLSEASRLMVASSICGLYSFFATDSPRLSAAARIRASAACSSANCSGGIFNRASMTGPACRMSSPASSLIMAMLMPLDISVLTSRAYLTTRSARSFAAARMLSPVGAALAAAACADASPDTASL